ncbi:Zn-ribbon domain-containing OB-fold protein [Desulfomonile tiedjei]|uniref:Putative nucleic-acid-binding protein containing a Zn-ribbon n=1 Tax=Desulfomonile tiedjei (strain ATCC 49306 / DSM 6799 / DCB-1) TaxID=706587 RepID=I4CEM0_DESTA|nr:Zn-ribbon domain-containing OB-fold protein [Desulfomonile tiedjei]AFM28011.1 putative nucleic-acid-binding protein containing a Zn-ribbon [Desulfomonile tiedjei DSM 6799]
MTTERDYGRLLTQTFSTPMPYEWSIGKYGSVFFHEIKEHQRFVGIRCPQCGKVYVPPRRLCAPCWNEMEEFVALPNMGTIMAFSVVNYPFPDPATGVQRPIPYTYGCIRIDGSDNIFYHVINETNVEKIAVGMKVEAVFRDKEEMQGNIQDIKHFRILD